MADMLLENESENQARLQTSDSRRSISSIQSVTEAQHDQTVKHDRCHQCKKFLLIVVILIAFIAYVIYGIDKYKKSKANPETKTILKPIRSYDAPLIYACPSSNYGIIHPFSLIQQDTNVAKMKEEYIYLCIASNSSYLAQNHLIDPYLTFENQAIPSFKYKCADLVTKKYTNHSAWAILPFTQVIAGNSETFTTTCYALIPPRNYQFSDAFSWQFVWEPAKNSQQYFAKDNVDTIGLDWVLSNQFSAEVQYNIIHPDSIDDWYKYLAANNFIYDNLYSYRFATSRGYDTLPWCLSSIGISLYSRTDLAGKKHRYYLTQLDTTGMMDRPSLEWLKDDETYIPQLIIYVQANTMTGVGDGDAYLFHSQTVEYQDYAFLDFISGIGGIVGLVLQAFGLITGVLLTAEFVGWTGWKGLAPYPSFAEAYQIRLRRFMNKEMKPMEMKPMEISEQFAIN